MTTGHIREIYALRSHVKLLEQQILILEIRAKCDEIIKQKESAMPNSVSYSDERTKTKVLKALAGKGDLDFDQVLGAVERMEEAGILFREEAEERPKVLRQAKAAAEGVKEAVTGNAPESPAEFPSTQTPPVQQNG